MKSPFENEERQAFRAMVIEFVEREIRNLGFSAVGELEFHDVLEVITRPILLSRGEKAHGVDEEERPIAVVIGEVSPHLIEGVDEDGGTRRSANGAEPGRGDQPG